MTYSRLCRLSSAHRSVCPAPRTSSQVTQCWARRAAHPPHNHASIHHSDSSIAHTKAPLARRSRSIYFLFSYVISSTFIFLISFILLFAHPRLFIYFIFIYQKSIYFIFFIFHFLAPLEFIYLFYLFSARNPYISYFIHFYILPCAIWQFIYLFYFPAPWAILAFWPGPGWAGARPWWAGWARAWGLRPGPGPASNKLKGFRGSQAPMPGNIFKSQAK